MKTLLLIVSGAAVLAVAPAIAQTAPAPAKGQRVQASKVQTRAELQSRIATRFGKLDTNRDGFVTQAETDAIKAQRKATREARFFDRFDANKDGSITRAEFAAAPTVDRKANRRAGKRHGAGGGILGRSDLDRDGRVSLAEAQQAALQRFDRADANRDGQLTREERRSARQQRRAQPKG